MTTKKISEKKLRANRQNAKKSTGPRTPQGKARSSRNAIKHGLLANQILLNDDNPDEDPADFEQLLNDLITELHPHGTAERLLVERIVVCYWRLRRAYRYEAQAIYNARHDVGNPLGPLARQITGVPNDPNRYILPGDREIQRIVRYETMIDRQLNRAMTQLQQLQKTRKSKSPTKHDTITSPTEHITCAIPKPSPCTNLSRQNTNAPNKPKSPPARSTSEVASLARLGGSPATGSSSPGPSVGNCNQKTPAQNKPTGAGAPSLSCKGTGAPSIRRMGGGRIRQTIPKPHAQNAGAQRKSAAGGNPTIP